MDDVPVVEPNQHDDVPIVPEPVLVDEDEESKEDKFKDEEDPQEEDDMEVDIKEDENEPELTYPYEEMDHLNPPPPASESKPEDAIEVDNPIKHEDETIPASVHEVSESSTAPFLYEDSDGLLPSLMKMDINSVFGRMASLSRRLCVMRRRMHWSRRKEKQRMSFMNHASKVCTFDLSRYSGSGPVRGQDAAPAARECTFVGFMKCNPTAFCCTEGAVKLLRWFEKTESVFGTRDCVEGKMVCFAAVTLQGPALTWCNSKTATMGLETVNRMPWTKIKQLMTAKFFPIEEVQRMDHELWNLKVKEYNIMAYTQRFNELALMCPRMVKPERVKVDAYIRVLTANIKGEVTSSKPANLSEAVRMAHKLMDQKSQGNVRAMVTAPTDGKLPLCERCFTRHVGPCTIKCHKCGKVGHKIRYYKEKNVDTGANALPMPTCYDCGEKGHTRNRCPKKVKQEEVREVHGQAYAIKDAEPKGPNVVTGTFLLNNRYAFVLFNSGFDRSFMDTSFSSMLDIDSVKI
nr:hypothetical protein [Tanacetum cinerariifolium]